MADLQINTIYQGDALETLKSFPDECVDCVVTSPPYYGLRDYGVAGQIGLEETPEEYIAKLVDVFAEVRRVLKKTGTCWVNMGDSYAGSGKGAADSTGRKHESLYNYKQCTNRGSEASDITCKAPSRIGYKSKDLMGMPWRLAFALQADGWHLRQEIIWAKPNPMPESVKDRFIKAHEYIFLITKSKRYYFDQESVRESRVWDGTETGIGFGHGYDENPKPRYKVPAGWDQEKGSHGTINRRYSFARKSKRVGVPGAQEQHREDREAIEYSGQRNKRSVWTIATQPCKAAHFATFPEELVRTCILAGCPEGGVVGDPFMGSGTTAKVAAALNRNYLGIEINPKYVLLAKSGVTRPIFAQSEGGK